MKLLETPIALPDKVRYLTQGIVQDDSLETPLGTEDQAAWQRVLDGLAGWERNPQELEDEDLEAPSSSTLRLASAVGTVLRNRHMEPPGIVVPNGDGGVVFRWRSGETTWAMEFEEDGSIESSLLRSGQLICRHSLHDAPHE